MLPSLSPGTSRWVAVVVAGLVSVGKDGLDCVAATSGDSTPCNTTTTVSTKADSNNGKNDFFNDAFNRA